MSWENKTDYCGLAIANKLSVKSATENRSGQYLEKLGQKGQIAATKSYGTANASPSVEYLIEDDISFTDGQIKLGEVKTVDGNKYALQTVDFSTGAGQEPTMSATSVQVEAAAATGRTFNLPAFELSKEEIAQILFSAFSLPQGTQQAPKNVACEVTQVTGQASCVIGLHTNNADPKASSVHSGKLTVTATIGQYGEQAPEVTAAQGWDVSSPLTSSDPDSDMPTWTITLSKPLALIEPSNNV